jgi:uncharacterized membrane protein
MSRFRETIEVGVPVRAAYEQLTQFESYPEFMTGVKQVIQLSDTETHWVMDLGGESREFDARLTECRPDQKVAWQSTGGPLLSEAITLKQMGTNRCQVIAELEADAMALLPSDAHAQESLGRQLKTDLARFKDYVEAQIGPVHAI